MSAPKRAKMDPTATTDEATPQRGTMVVSFQSMDGEAAGPQIDIPLDSTPQQMEQIVNELLDNPDKVPYAFYLAQAGDAELMTSLRDIVGEHDISTETVLEIKYHPLSLFKVHPVTRCTDSMPGHTEAILHVSFSPEGKRLGSGGGDTTVRFWDVDTCLPQHVCRGHKHHVLCTAWAPNGKRFASGDKKGQIRIWDPKTGKQMGREMTNHRQWVTSLSWEPLHKNKECNRLVSSSKDGTARVWNVKTGRCEFSLTGHQDSVEFVRWGGEGFIYTGSRDRTIMVWAVDDQVTDGSGPYKLVRVLKGHAHRINALALSTDYLCRTGPFTPERPGGIEEDLVEDPDRAYEQAVERYNAAKEKSGNGAIPFERLVSCSDDFTLYMWYPTLDKKPVVRMTGHAQAVTHINFSPDGRYLASAAFDKKIKVWDGRNGRFVATLTGHVGSVYQVCWSPDSRLIASGSKDSTIRVWKVAEPKKAKYVLSGHADEVYALDWSPDGGMIASGSKDRLVKVWKN